MEWKRTHLRKCTRGRIYGTPEGRQGEEGALEDKVDERVKRLSFTSSISLYPYGFFLGIVIAMETSRGRQRSPENGLGERGQTGHVRAR